MTAQGEAYSTALRRSPLGSRVMLNSTSSPTEKASGPPSSAEKWKNISPGLSQHLMKPNWVRMVMTCRYSHELSHNNVECYHLFLENSDYTSCHGQAVVGVSASIA